MIRLKANTVKKKIAQTGLSVSAWGAANGFTQGTLSGWITGRRNIKHSSLSKLATALRCEPEEIAEIFWVFDNSVAVQLEVDREEICGIFGNLSAEQRKAIINMANLMADANWKKEREQIEHYAPHGIINSTHPEGTKDCTS